MKDDRGAAFRAWADAASRTERGALLLANLAHEVKHSSISPAVLRRFVETLADCWVASHGASPEQVLREALAQLGDDRFCQGQPALDAPQSCSRVMATQDFFRHHVNLNALGVVADFESVPTHAIQRLEAEGLATHVGGTLTTSKPVVWVTDSQQVAELRSSTKLELATALRHRLGLMHLGDGQQLLEVVYPSGTVPSQSCPLRPPTFLDGAGSPIYRSKRSDSGWGTTVDLDSGGDGLPEAVHPPMELTDGFRIRDLGKVSAGQKSVPPPGLTERAPAQWGPDWVAKLIAYMAGN